MNRLLLLFLFSLSIAVAYGQIDSTSASTEIDEIIVTGEKQLPSASVANTQTIKIAQSERLSSASLSNTIRRMAGADIKDYGGIGGLKTISVQSLGAKHTIVSYDGIALSDCQNGQIDLGRFSLEQLDQIRLTIGEGNDILHPALHFSLPSVLELASPTPDYDLKNYNLTAKINTGSFGLVNPFIAFDHKIGKQNWIRTSADFLRADGQYPYTLTNGQLKTEEHRKNSAIKSGHSEVNGHFFLSPNCQLNAKSYYFNSNRELPGSIILYNTNSNETLKDQNFFTQLQLRTDWEKTTLIVNGKFNWAACQYHDEATKYPNGEVNNNYYQREWYGSIVARHRINKHLSFANATDYVFNSFNANTYNCVFPKRHSLLDAISGHFENHWLTSTATLLGAYFRNEVEIGDAPDSQKRLSPALSVAIKPFRPKLYFRASFKDIFRMPTFNELYFNSVGAKSLNPERARQYNIGLSYHYDANKKFKNFALATNAYHNEVKDKIVGIPRMFEWSILNMGRVTIYGVDCNTNCEVSTSQRTALFFSAKYAYQYAIDITDEKSDIYKHQIPYTPLHSGNGSLAFENPVLNIAYCLNVVGERYCLPQNTKANKVEAYTEHNITLYKQLKFKHLTTKIRGDILNLTDKQYEVVKYYPMPKRSYKASIEFIF